MTDSDDNILKFCREEIDAAGLLPEPSGEHPTGALVADLRDRKLGRVLLLGTAISLSIAGGIAVGAIATWITESPRLSVTELPAHPAVEQAPADLQTQLLQWWNDRNAMAPSPRHGGR